MPSPWPAPATQPLSRLCVLRLGGCSRGQQAVLGCDDGQQRLVVEKRLVAGVGPQDLSFAVDDESTMQLHLRFSVGLRLEGSVLLSHFVVLVGQHGEAEATVFLESFGSQIDRIATDRPTSQFLQYNKRTPRLLANSIFEQSDWLITSPNELKYVPYANDNYYHLRSQ